MPLSDQSNTPEPFDSKLVGYPDGMGWNCDECGTPIGDADACLEHPEAGLRRVNQRYVWGPGPDDFNDVVVEFRQ